MRIFLMAAMVLTGLYLSGCTSIPSNPNLTGTWAYTLTESKNEKEFQGRMRLTQSVYELSGKANDAFGEFIVSGNVQGPKFNLDFVKSDKSLKYKWKVSMTSFDTFEGTFTTSSGYSGGVTASRVK